MKNMLVLSLLVTASLGGCWEGYSSGQRVGVPFKYSHKGFVCKTWEGSANLGGMRQETSPDGKSTSMVPNTWDFTVRDGDTAKFSPVIDNAIENGQTLKFSYSQEAFPVCDSDHGYFVTDIKILNR